MTRALAADIAPRLEERLKEILEATHETDPLILVRRVRVIASFGLSELTGADPFDLVEAHNDER